MLMARFADSRASCEEAIGIARRVGARAAEGHARNTLGYDLACLGDRERGVVELRAALNIAEEVADLDNLARARRCWCGDAVTRPATPHAEPTITPARSALDRYGSGSHILAKLGVRSRVEAAATAHGLGLLGADRDEAESGTSLSSVQ
jgi:hypothetical protein